MTREETIKILDVNNTSAKELEMIKNYKGFNGREAIFMALKDACLMAVAALREQEERRQISVTERLPDKPMRCLVYTKRGEYGGYEITYYNQGFYTQYAEVTHWMQLPELPQPPKGE